MKNIPFFLFVDDEYFLQNDSLFSPNIHSNKFIFSKQTSNARLRARSVLSRRSAIFELTANYFVPQFQTATSKKIEIDAGFEVLMYGYI